MVEASSVEIRKVNKFYGQFHALKDIDLSIPPGKVTCLIGPSGSGKSSLLRCINFLEEYDSGEVLNVMKALAAGGMTMVVVTHEMGFAAHVADQVAFLEAGELVGVDVPSRILREPEDPRIQSFLRTYHERNVI